jgi:hypothetical protein
MHIRYFVLFSGGHGGRGRRCCDGEEHGGHGGGLDEQRGVAPHGRASQRELLGGGGRGARVGEGHGGRCEMGRGGCCGDRLHRTLTNINKHKQTFPISYIQNMLPMVGEQCDNQRKDYG